MQFLKSFFIFLWDIVKMAAIALVFAGLVRYFLIQPFFVEGASMEPSFLSGEYLLIDEASYYFKSVERGEVVVFHYPLDASKYYIKRVIGVPGETVEIKDGKVIIYNNDNSDGFFIEEDYLSGDGITLGNIKKKLGKNEYFVLGDNRLVSSDSRQWGTLPRNNIVGRVWVRAWPIDKVKIFGY